MRRFKKIISVMLAAVLLLGLMVTAAGAAFSDLTGHWAKTYMEDLAQKGYLTGYTDGTMKPENKITGAEALALLSRFYAPDDEAMERIDQDFGAYVSGLLPSGLAWVKEEAEVCLAAGVITKTELAELKLAEPIEKELLAVFLVRAMQQGSAAESYGTGVALSFSDEQDITTAYRGYIYTLVRAGIVEGDDKNNFSPHLSVTRAVVATMVSRALDYVSRNNIRLEIEGYRNTTSQEGILVAASGSTISVRGMDGLIRYYEVSAGAKTTVNGDTKLLSSLYVGSYVTVTVDTAGKVTAVEVESSTEITWVQGAVVRTSTGGNGLKQIYISNADTGSYTAYTVSGSTPLLQNGASVDFASLKTGYFATLKLKNTNLSIVYAESGAEKLTGRIAALNYDSTVTLLVEDSVGTTYCFYLDVANLPAILRGTVAVSIDRLKVGDTITVNLTAGQVASITTAAGTETTVTGTLTSMVTTVNGISWILTTDTGTATCTIDLNAAVYSGEKAIQLSAIQAGDQVKLVLYDNVATEIYLLESTPTVAKITGKVLSADARTRQLILLISDKLVYVKVPASISVIEAATGSALSLTSIQTGSQAVVYGAYTDSSNFTATSVIIEG